ncbi:MAG: hypothetical protein QG650_1024 [Patescibacteria group bacterium]|nr:hypothetical protein [Patescibacteria group bacterium]
MSLGAILFVVIAAFVATIAFSKPQKKRDDAKERILNEILKASEPLKAHQIGDALDIPDSVKT